MAHIDALAPVERHPGEETLKMMAILALALATLSPDTSGTLPAFMQAGKLEALCQAEGDLADAELCAGYILGSVDQALVEQTLWGRRRSALCLPQDVTVDQLKSGIVTYIRQRPEQTNFAAATVIAAALKANYPCGARRGGR